MVVFLGPAAFNKYAYTLEGNALLPIVELGLLFIFLLHIYKTVTMYINNQRARPVGYIRKRYAGPPSRKSIASSTMIVSGLWLLLFLIIHVKTFRFGVDQPWPAGGRDLYRTELETFASPVVTAFYAVSMVFVGSHLWHGIASAFQSLGADQPRWTPRVLAFGKIMAVLIAGGFIVIAVWAHYAGAHP